MTISQQIGFAGIKAVIFDLDGTLYDKSRLPLHMIFNQLFHGSLSMLKQERKVRKLLKGQSFGTEKAFYDNFFSKFGGDKARNWYFDSYIPQMTKVLQKHYKIAPWVEKTLAELRSQSIKVVVFSDYGSVENRLAAIGFNKEWADYIFDAPALGGLKPCRESFLAVCEKIGMEPQNCLMVGDRDDTDGAGANAVGMNYIKVDKASEPHFSPQI